MSIRSVLPVVALAILGLVLFGQLRELLSEPTLWPPDDFVEYWAAAKLTLAGENPYDPELLLPLERFAGRDTQEAVMMWNPPWSMAVVLPLGLLPPREAQLLWLAINLLAMGCSGDRLWVLLGGHPSRRWLGWLITFGALPTVFALQSGQISPLLLLGAVLFLEASRKGWDGLAGASTVLVAIKPHLAYLLWAAIAVQAVLEGRWRVLLGAATAGLLAVGCALLFNQQLMQQYLDALGNRPPIQWVSPTLGTVLRLACGEKLFRLQFIPMLFGLGWFAIAHWNRYSRSRSQHRDWRRELPVLLLVSFATAPYGAWPFDMVLLLPAAMWLIIRTPSPARVWVVAGLVIINIGCLVLNLLHVTSDWFLWVSPVVLALYVLAQHRWGAVEVRATETTRLQASPALVSS